MKNRFRLSLAAISILAMVVTLESQLRGQEAGLPGSGNANQPGANADVGQDVDPGNIDKLLAMADKDIGQLSQVNVASGHTGSAGLDMPINTVERRESTVGQTPAAVYVVTNEMIRRSGARNVPEVLRTVPGVEVARINASAWAISIRGNNSRFANKLLVQIDGVAIYSPTHSGTFWEREYVMLEDVDRIEVIRGPGAAVWGVNAVNGVINIVTKAAKDTKGVYLDAGAGNEHSGFADARVGGQSGNLHWRTYGMTMGDSTGFVSPPSIANDNPSMNQGGFRADWTPTEEDTITIQSDFYNGVDKQFGPYTPPATPSQMNCSMARTLTRWTRKIDDDTDYALQMYYYNPYAAGLNINSVATFDADFQYHMKRNRHDIVLGTEYRNYDELFFYGGMSMRVADSEQIPSYFIQDTITLVEDRYFLTLGSKFDHNSVTDFEMQPTARIMWTPNKKTSVWAAISRAARTPSLVDRMWSSPKSEDLMAYEAGIRRAPTEKFYWDLAIFTNRYSGMLASPSFGYQNVELENSYGCEISSTYELTKQWRLRGSYSAIIENFTIPAGYTPEIPIGATPRNMYYLQSGWDIGRDVTFDLMFRYVDSLPIGVPAYFASDARCAWRPRKNLELSVVGQNLFAGKHYEFVTSSQSNPTMIGPSVYGMAAWRY
jgi:iron complex outermembrane receptor protein